MVAQMLPILKVSRIVSRLVRRLNPLILKCIKMAKISSKKTLSQTLKNWITLIRSIFCWKPWWSKGTSVLKTMWRSKLWRENTSTRSRWLPACRARVSSSSIKSPRGKSLSTKRPKRSTTSGKSICKTSSKSISKTRRLRATIKTCSHPNSHSKLRPKRWRIELIRESRKS